MIALAEIRRAARWLAGSRGFAGVVVGSLAVGIGTAGAMFAVTDALWFRAPFGVQEPWDVVRVQFRYRGESSLVERTSYPAFSDLRASGAFASLAAHTRASVSLGSGPDARLVDAMLVSEDFFSVLSPTPHLGTLSLAEVGSHDGGQNVVISYGLWQRHFGSDPEIVGASITFAGTSYSVSGVLQRGFQSPSNRPIDVWLPLEHAVPALVAPDDWWIAPDDWRNNREPWLRLVGRFAPGADRTETEQRAGSALEAQRQSLSESRPKADVVTVSLVPGRDGVASLEGKVSLWLGGVSVFVLLIACANVSSLVLVRSLARRREYFVRLALGASAWNLIRHSLANTLVIVLVGTVGATGVSYFLRNAVAGFVSVGIPLSRDLWDLRAAGALMASAAVAFMLVWAASPTPRRLAAQSSAWMTRRNGEEVGSTARRLLLAVQAGLCLSLLFAAILFVTSVRRVESLDLGVDLDKTIQITVNLPPDGTDSVQQAEIYERALRGGPHPLDRFASQLRWNPGS